MSFLMRKALALFSPKASSVAPVAFNGTFNVDVPLGGAAQGWILSSIGKIQGGKLVHESTVNSQRRSNCEISTGFVKGATYVLNAEITGANANDVAIGVDQSSSSSSFVLISGTDSDFVKTPNNNVQFTVRSNALKIRVYVISYTIGTYYVDNMTINPV